MLDAPSTSTLRIVPRRSLLVSGLVSIVVVFVPVSALLYWYAIPRGQGGYVAAAQATVVVIGLAVMLRQLTVDTVVTDREIRGRGIFSPLVRVPLERIARVDLVPTYVGQSPEPVLQLLARDAEGRRLYRLRGNFWRPGDLERVAAALPAPATVVAEPMALKEFFAAYPGSAYWFEARPVLVGILVLLAIAGGLALTVAAMDVLGLPIRL